MRQLEGKGLAGSRRGASPVQLGRTRLDLCPSAPLPVPVPVPSRPRIVRLPTPVDAGCPLRSWMVEHQPLVNLVKRPAPPERGTFCRGIWRSIFHSSTSPLGGGAWGSILSEISAALLGCCRWHRRSCPEGSLWPGRYSTSHNCHRCSTVWYAGGTGCL